MPVCKGAKKAVTPVTPVTPQPTRSTCSRQRKRTCHESKSFFLNVPRAGLEPAQLQ